MPVSVSASFVSCSAELLPALASAAEDLGLSFLPGEVEDPGRERPLTAAGGWLRLPEAWGAEALLLRRLPRALPSPLELRQLRASASSGDDPGAFTVEGLLARRLHPDGTVEELRADALRHPFTHSAPRPLPHHSPDALRAALDALLTTTAAELLPRARAPLSAPWRLRRPEGWQPPPAFALALEDGEAAPALAARLVTPGGSHGLSAEAVAWMRWALKGSGLLDERSPAPDLDRWVPRLLRRMGLDAVPDPETAEWRAQRLRLTAAERGAQVAGGRRLPAWKLSPGAWGLSARELERLRELAARSHDREHLAYAEAWLKALRGAREASLEIGDARPGPAPR